MCSGHPVCLFLVTQTALDFPFSNHLLNKSILFSGKVGALFPAHSYIESVPLRDLLLVHFLILMVQMRCGLGERTLPLLETQVRTPRQDFHGRSRSIKITC